MYVLDVYQTVTLLGYWDWLCNWDGQIENVDQARRSWGLIKLTSGELIERDMIFNFRWIQIKNLVILLNKS